MEGYSLRKILTVSIIASLSLVMVCSVVGCFWNSESALPSLSESGNQSSGNYAPGENGKMISGEFGDDTTGIAELTKRPDGDKTEPTLETRDFDPKNEYTKPGETQPGPTPETKRPQGDVTSAAPDDTTPVSGDVAGPGDTADVQTPETSSPDDSLPADTLIPDVSSVPDVTSQSPDEPGTTSGEPGTGSEDTTPETPGTTPEQTSGGETTTSPGTQNTGDAQQPEHTNQNPEDTTSPAGTGEAGSSAGDTTSGPTETGTQTSDNPGGTGTSSDPPVSGGQTPETQADPEPGTQPEETGHVHSFGAWTTIVEPGCQTSGTEKRECACGETETRTVNPLGHLTVTDPRVEPTCTEYGKTEGSHCVRCGYVIVAQQPIAPSHTPYVSKQRVEPTATACGHTEEISCKVCGAVLTGSTPIEPTGLTDPDNYSSDYAYRSLSELPNSDKLQELYRIIDEAAKQFHSDGSDASRTLAFNGQSIDDINLDDNTKFDASPYAIAIEALAEGLTDGEIYVVWSAYKTDHPLYYWIANTALTMPTGNQGQSGTLVVILCDASYSSGSARTAFNNKIYSDVGDFLSAASAGGSVYGEMMTIHDAISNEIDYKWNSVHQPDESPASHSIVGFFTREGGVCECYAKTMQLFMNFRGIENVYVYNTGHAWNLVKANDGNWYWIDPTWDDPDNFDYPLHYCYFKNDYEDIYEGSGLTGSGCFLEMEGHAVLPAGGPDTALEVDVNGTTYTYTYFELGIFWVYSLPQRAATAYSGPTD